MPIKFTTKIFILAFTFIGLNTVLNAQRINNYISKDSLSVGDTFEYTLIARHTSPVETLILPDSSAFGDFISIMNIRHFKLEPLGDSIVYSLAFFGTQDTLLPIESVRLVEANGDTSDYLVPSAPIFFKSVLPDTTAEFKPYKPLFTFVNLLWFIIALLLLLAAYALWYYFSRIRNREGDKTEEISEIFESTDFINPLERLEQQILQLRRTHVEHVLADAKTYYIELGNAFRVYFEAVYQFPAMEQTSSEIIRMIRAQSLDQKFIGLIAKMLRDGDLVKFARFKPSEALWRTHLDDALWILEQLKTEDLGRIDTLRELHAQEELERKEAFDQKMAAQKELEADNETQNTNTEHSDEVKQ